MHDFEVVMHELESFSEDLSKKPMLVVATKLDAAQDPERVKSLQRMSRKLGLPFFKISSVTGEGLDALKQAMAEHVLSPITEGEATASEAAGPLRSRRSASRSRCPYRVVSKIGQSCSLPEW